MKPPARPAIIQIRKAGVYGLGGDMELPTICELSRVK
jgi:hypothetical protein